MTGILAVWNDRSEARAADYERWYTGEHIPERMAVPGFLTALRYEAIDADRGFFTFYDLDDPHVLTTPVYLERLANPTAQTRAIMPDFQGMIRSVFVETHREGRGAGGAAVVVRYMSGKPRDPSAILRKTVEESEVVNIRVWESAPGNEPTKTTESLIRPTRDEVASGAIVIDVARVASAERLSAALRGDAAFAGTSVGCYRLLSAETN